MKYYILTSLLIISILIVSFYFWAKKSNYSVSEYTEVTNFSISSNNPSDTFSVMTYNIGYLSGMTNNLPLERSLLDFKTRMDKAIALFLDKDPQIIAFQEIDFSSNRSFNTNQYEQIANSCSFINGAKAINWDKTYVPFPYWPMKYHFGKIYSGQAILSNYKIFSNQRIVLPQPESNTFYYNDFYLDRLAQKTWLNLGDDSLLIINVHFEAWNGPTRELQSTIIIDLYQKYEKEYPIILLGDFNCTPPYSKNAYKEATIKSLLDIPSLTSVIDESRYLRSPKDFYTFNSETPDQKIDYIFYNQLFLTCIESKVLRDVTKVSDHLPVFARFELKNN